ncbi:MAG: tetratricopeptide repeat protein [Rhodospirillales bacterium]|nr:tetratricopeptide repeat protein [Rhodospirillales bacterium]MCW8863172.1 tetratricopeptide repeat protein [Rhodospirillales bacterium]MCW8952008.1 tetratricopeptide repeat protein [Rhodospirillales bacterium]MCW8971559.1 tetratricopeptide repeat protein [Rhodospirillales bacterium]MCW9002281.1 tetratricopeptide repeat protein [Rhodospirillales bacterium]
MFRAMKYLAVVAVLVAAAIWLADRPGAVSLVWQGYRIDTTMAVLLIGVAALSVMAALFYRLWLFFRRAPSRIGDSWRERKRRKGYDALTQGMVAVAAGDAVEAARLARKAENLLEEPPLTMLLSAQAAQLNGDEGAAERFFDAMRANPEMEFLGLRGRLNQAITAGDDVTALQLARRAFQIKPKTAWVGNTLFDLLVAEGRWGEAETILKSSEKNGHCDASTASRHRAVVLLMQGRQAESAGDGREAMKLMVRAVNLAPDLTPAVVDLVRVYVDAGRKRKAAAVVEAAWMRNPHPDLFTAYGTCGPVSLDPVKAMQRTERLAGFNPNHMESRLALATSALLAGLWGEARKNLSLVLADGSVDGQPPGRVCRMMAELEEAENGDAQAARGWLQKAAMAHPDPAWVCGGCGNALEQWQPLCPNCRAFDTMTWRAPIRVAALGVDATAEKSVALLSGDAGGDAGDGDAPLIEVEKEASSQH